MSDMDKVLKWAGVAGKAIGGIVAIVTAIWGMKKESIPAEEGRKEIEKIDKAIADAIKAEDDLFT